MSGQKSFIFNQKPHVSSPSVTEVSFIQLFACVSLPLSVNRHQENPLAADFPARSRIPVNPQCT